MQNGKRHGIWMWYREDGITLLSEHAYSNGIKHGFNRGWYTNGNIFRDTPYKNGEKHGLARELDSDGKPIEEIYYFEGIKHGIARFWKENAGFQGLKVPMGDGTWLWFYISGKEVTEEHYIQKSESDPTLPKFKRE